MEKLLQTQACAFILGVDVSKDSLDVCLIDSQTQQASSQKFNNNKEGFRRLKAWCKLQSCGAGPETLACMEHTGLYTRQLVHYLLARDVRVWLESALQIKRSIGMARGKDDRVDAQRIARYALLHQQQAKCVNLSSVTLERLKDLQANRSRLLKALQSIKVTIKELLQIDPVSGKTLEQVNKKAVRGLEKSIEQVEERMQGFIRQDQSLKQKYDLLTSVKGVGKVLATSLLVYTHGFNRMEDGRKLACYCGVAPFEYRSGTSVRGRTGVSRLANKELKHVLHLAAMNSVRYNQELKAYFERKVAEGKSKMSVLNAVRNKLLHQIVAVVKRGTPYVIKLDKV
ncbi:IS110 family transposase [Rufibacter quisquiliarum]|uniref:Transposase n=1 Tax=Rufibacter quisquiliarum TaxID=1549639 RepID=A0A839GL48_9BACT|nr:IS110 family transposase [Rufibacter quisquiliarum]MBA9079410.1 transposase [Rufibacter quisquiliarum]